MLALPEVIALDRRTVRRRFEERFSATRMAKDYVNVYRKLLKQEHAGRGPLPGAIGIAWKICGLGSLR